MWRPLSGDSASTGASWRRCGRRSATTSRWTFYTSSWT
uniref:Uncharacterized protein n=1 Tax=Arundo donax TaxID=35708 RepID=A0A0A9A6B8_ARUDO